MKLMLNDEDTKIIEKSESIVGISERNGNYIELDELIGIIDSLIYEYHLLEEKYEDFEKEVEDNYEYRADDPHDYYDESDFH